MRKAEEKLALESMSNAVPSYDGDDSMAQGTPAESGRETMPLLPDRHAII
jgi:hypothetical protein